MSLRYPARIISIACQRSCLSGLIAPGATPTDFTDFRINAFPYKLAQHSLYCMGFSAHRSKPACTRARTHTRVRG